MVEYDPAFLSTENDNLKLAPRRLVLWPAICCEDYSYKTISCLRCASMPSPRHFRAHMLVCVLLVDNSQIQAFANVARWRFLSIEEEPSCHLDVALGSLKSLNCGLPVSAQ